MPEYSHIQTYVRYSGLKWEVADNGFMYQGGNADAEEVPVEGLSLHVRSYLVGLTPEVFPELSESWLEVSLLFWTEEITADYRTGELRSEVQPYIWSLMEQFADYYDQAGIYFTDEATGGKPWDAAVTGNNGELWSFDAALIPEELIERYGRPDEQLFHYTYSGKRLLLVRREVWGGEPWL
ncbi:hypothetical protein R70723_20260 [Paenibacillus sp. FSL R7-0273]|uniref:hypothetical protein n=1 Tax=Paenibacillus sp. FSL R7-0273 TaxID=1536772 RepID=UPI0004F86135|nr:hypothetical protein [Paenibacillus sp. FSL R7-0273]AIQ47979.1 hypothetical protein R70723_20260 [Paenibacillus sp. FSL R7-0273]OMF94472.1 hypothetical protein BK144_08040 [Paenibacillus sp. FSL R7-0273]